MIVRGVEAGDVDEGDGYGVLATIMEWSSMAGIDWVGWDDEGFNHFWGGCSCSEDVKVFDPTIF